MKSNYIKTIVRSLTILLVCVLPAGCSDKDSDEPIEGEDPVIELTAEQEAYTTLAGNFFQSSQPSEGRVLDEAKPSERSVIAETYESALEDFERFLPSNEREERFINRTADGISVDLGELGYVRFEVADGDGVVVKVTVALDELPRYTIIYRTESSFGDNYSQRFSEGDLVRFTCPVVKRDGEVSNRQTEGVVPRLTSDCFVGLLSQRLGTSFYLRADGFLGWRRAAIAGVFRRLLIFLQTLAQLAVFLKQPVDIPIQSPYFSVLRIYGSLHGL